MPRKGGRMDAEACRLCLSYDLTFELVQIIIHWHFAHSAWNVDFAIGGNAKKATIKCPVQRLCKRETVSNVVGSSLANRDHMRRLNLIEQVWRGNGDAAYRASLLVLLPDSFAEDGTASDPPLSRLDPRNFGPHNLKLPLCKPFNFFRRLR